MAVEVQHVGFDRFLWAGVAAVAVRQLGDAPAGAHPAAGAEAAHAEQVVAFAGEVGAAPAAFEGGLGEGEVDGNDVDARPQLVDLFFGAQFFDLGIAQVFPAELAQLKPLHFVQLTCLLEGLFQVQQRPPFTENGILHFMDQRAEESGESRFPFINGLVFTEIGQVFALGAGGPPEQTVNSKKCSQSQAGYFPGQFFRHVTAV